MTLSGVAGDKKVLDVMGGKLAPGKLRSQARFQKAWAEYRAEAKKRTAAKVCPSRSTPDELRVKGRKLSPKGAAYLKRKHPKLPPVERRYAAMVERELRVLAAERAAVEALPNDPRVCVSMRRGARGYQQHVDQVGELWRSAQPHLSVKAKKELGPAIAEALEDARALAKAARRCGK